MINREIKGIPKIHDQQTEITDCSKIHDQQTEITDISKTHDQQIEITIHDHQTDINQNS